MKRYIHAATDLDKTGERTTSARSSNRPPIVTDPDKPWLVDYDLSKMTDEQWERMERKRIQQEMADEADYYDREHHEGIYASEYNEDADTYVVKIWYETDPGHDTLGPVADEEVFFQVANSPDEAIEQVKMQWNGPIDRIEVVDVNPEEDDDVDTPFNSSEEVYGSAETGETMCLLVFDFATDGYHTTDDINRIIDTAVEAGGGHVVDVAGNPSYDDVDYSMYSDYEDVTIGQAIVEFTWSGRFDKKAINETLAKELSAIGYEFLGSDFHGFD